MGPDGRKRIRRRCKTRSRRGGKKTVSEPVKACESMKHSSSLVDNASLSSDDDRAKRVRITDSLKVEALVVSQSMQQRCERGTSQSSSSSPPSSVMAAVVDEQVSSSVTAAVPPAATTSTCDDAMSKLTDGMKLKVTGYIELLKKVDQPFNDPNDNSWIACFVGDMCSGGMKLTTDDVLEWMERLPDIFTPEAIDILRQHYNRLRALEQETNAVHQNLRQVLSEMDGYEADDDYEDGNEEDSAKFSDEGGCTSDTNS